MMTKWIYDPNRARVSALDDGSVRIDIINVFGGTEAERDEHGSLVAAAPELLSACKGCLDLLCTKYNNGIVEIKLDTAGALILKLKNAIGKAEGEL
jgi:hypothetical protein